MLLCIVELKINMIINRGKWLNTDNFISGDSSPDEITKKIIKILDLKFDEDGYLVNIKDEYMSLVTYSPFAIDEYIRMLKKWRELRGYMNQSSFMMRKLLNSLGLLISWRNPSWYILVLASFTQA